MTRSRRPWRRWRHQDVPDSQGETSTPTSEHGRATTEELEELRNEVAELRQDADELRYRLKESEARIGSLEDETSERAQIIETLSEWCQEQEVVLSTHRDVVAAMGAAARILDKDPFVRDVESATSEHEDPPPPSRPVIT